MCVSLGATKVSVINRNISSLVGGEIHKVVCLYVCFVGDGKMEKTEVTCQSVARCTLWHSSYAGVRKSLRLLAQAEPLLNPECACTTECVFVCVWEIRWCFCVCQWEIPLVLSKWLPAEKHGLKNVRDSSGFCKRWTNVPWPESFTQLILCEKWLAGEMHLRIVDSKHFICHMYLKCL